MAREALNYRTLEGVPGQYFDCPHGMGMLSVKACAAAYCDAMSPSGLKEGRRASCRSCPVGAMHAGVSPVEQSLSRFLGSGTCSRCHGDARRLIRGSICVSCYNREREVLLDRNAKGGKPIHGKPIYSLTVSINIENGQQAQVRRMDKVTSRQEAFLSILRCESRGVSLGWVGTPVIRAGEAA